MSRALFLPLVLVLALATGAVALAAGAVLGSAPSPAAGNGANDAVVRRFYAAINEAIRTGDVAPLDALLAPGFADHPAPADGIPARAAVLRAVLALHAESPDLRVEVETVAADGDTVTVHSRLHREGIGGAPATVTAGPTAVGGRIDVFRVESGKVAEHWGIGDGGARCGDPIDQGNGLPAVGSGSFGAALSPDGPLWAGPRETPEVLWQSPGAVSTDSVVEGGIVYAAGWDGTILALDAATGTARWRYPTGEQVFAPPVVAEGTLYAVAVSGSVYALDAATGQERWRTRAAGLVGRGLTLADGTLYLATGSAPTPAVAGGVVYAARGEQETIVQAFDAETGAGRWRFSLADRALYAIETATFHTRWQLTLNEDVGGALVLAGAAVYVVADGLARVDAATGRVRWRMDDVTAAPHTSPAIGDGLVYLAEYDGRLHAIESGTGVERWVVDTGGAIVSSPVVAAGVVFLGSRDGNLYAVDAASGIACGRIALGGIVQTPAVAGGVAYVATMDGHLSAVAVDGSP